MLLFAYDMRHVFSWLGSNLNIYMSYLYFILRHFNAYLDLTNISDAFGKPRLWVDALSQNAFDTGAGMGLMIPYSSYMTKKNGIVKYGHLIPATNNLIR